MQLIRKYFPELTAEQDEKFAQLENLYKEWNSRINVISRKDIDLLYERHVLHSLAIARIINFRPGTTVLDVGTGGGFPGIPLAILFPDTRFHLVDSIRKKIFVVQEIVAATGLKNVEAEQIRAEKIRGQYDFIVSRAVTNLKDFMGWVSNKVKRTGFNDLPNGILYLKGGDLREEISSVNTKVKVLDIDFFEEEFFSSKAVVYIPLEKKH